MKNYLVLQVGGEALGQQPITRKKNLKAKNTTKQSRMKQNLRRQKLRKRTMNTASLECNGQRRFTCGHRTVGGEEEDRNNHGGTK